jgi:hypothetical protein
MFEYEKMVLEYKAMSEEELAETFGIATATTKPGAEAPKVYFVGDGKLVYVGYTRRADARIVTLQNMSPVRLSTPVVRPGSLKLRNFIQATLAYMGYQDHGDWYRSNHVLEALIAADDFSQAVLSLVNRMTVSVSFDEENEQ